MQFDIVLPSIISVIAIIAVVFFPKFSRKMKPIIEEREFQVRDTIFLVIAIGLMITIIAFIPQQAILVLFMVACSFLLFLCTYILVEKWYFALLPPIIFIALYIFYWNLFFANIFAIAFAIFISLFMGSFFSWRTILIFASLVTIMDSIQVFGTGFMGDAANKFVDLKLPILIIMPTFPKVSQIGLGLGDIFLGALLAIQTMQKYDKKAGIISAITIGLAFSFFEIALFHYQFAQYFPATIVVVCGWLLGIAFHLLITRKLTS